jgi:8-oxo-dGTP pyrophosphatase MutT (NUDIX family)
MTPDRRVLLEQRADSRYWGFISGGIRDTESVVAALAREVQEETALALASHRLAAIYSNPGRIIAYPDGNVSQVVTMAFVGALEPGEPSPSTESRQLAWFGLAELSGVDIAPTHRAFRDLIASGGADGDDGVVLA